RDWKSHVHRRAGAPLDRERAGVVGECRSDEAFLARDSSAWSTVFEEVSDSIESGEASHGNQTASDRRAVQRGGRRDHGFGATHMRTSIEAGLPSRVHGNAVAFRASRTHASTCEPARGAVTGASTTSVVAPVGEIASVTSNEASASTHLAILSAASS